VKFFVKNKPIFLIPIFFLFYSFLSISQTFVNGDLNGSTIVSSLTPNSWQQVPYTDPVSNATSAPQATSDLTSLTGPIISSGIIGNPYSGNTFTSGLHSYSTPNNILFREGIMQTVSGFTPGNQYEIKFYQSVVKQSTCLDSSGSWSVFADGTLLSITTPTFSDAPFNSTSFIWEQRTITFQATSNVHTIKFLPTDDDPIINEENGGAGVRMGIDSISLSPYFGVPLTNLGNDTTLCLGDSLIQDVFCSGCTYLWSNGSTLSNNEFVNSGTFWVQVTNAFGTSMDSITVTFQERPIVTLGADTTLCVGSSLILDINQPFNVHYIWQDGSDTSTININVSGEYSVSVDNLGCIVTDTIVVSFVPIPSVSLLVSDTTLCVGQQAQIGYSGSNIDYIIWSDGGTGQNLTTSSDTIYWISAFNDCGQFTDTLIVNFIDYPVLNFGNDTSICDGNSLVLDASQTSIMNYLWQDGSNSSTFFINQSGEFSVTVNNLGCIAADTININFINNPEVSINITDTSLCVGEMLQLSFLGSNVNSVIWSNGETGQFINTSLDSLYWITGFNECGQASDTTVINFIDFPIVNLGDDTSICEGNTLVLDASQTSTMNYLWQDGSNSSTFFINQSGEYSVTVNNLGCITTDTITINFLNNPEISMSITDTSLCAGEMIQLSFFDSNVNSVIWSNGETGQFINTSLDSLYWITGFNECGQASDTTVINFIDFPIVNLGDDTSICEGFTFFLDGSQTFNANYLWQNGSTNPSIDVNSSGLYYVQVDNNGCISYDSINISVVSMPITILPNDTLICSDTQLIVEVDNPNYNFVEWNNGSNELPLIINEDGLYILEMNNLCGSSTDSINVSIYNCDCSFYLPNSFSPNGDGVNDFFHIIGICDDLINYELKIYNRWGELIFESSNHLESWNGKFKDYNVPDGVYIYQLRYENSIAIFDQITGHINLIR